MVPLVLDRSNVGEFLSSLRKSAKPKGGMSGLARASGLNRAGLYRALSEGGNPRLRSLLDLIENVGFELVLHEIGNKAGPHFHARLIETRAKGVPRRILLKIVRRILATVKPREIWLFGSAAAGRMTPDSDLDILVIQDNVRDPSKEASAIRKTIGSLGWPLDLFVMGRREFMETGDVVGSLAYPARHSGRLLYARP